MITAYEPRYRLSDNLFQEARTIIDRSGAAEHIDAFHHQTKGNGGRDPSGITYTTAAVLVCALSLIMLNRTPTLKAILNTIADLTARQLTDVGMGGQDTGRIFGGPGEQRRERQRFSAWLHRRLHAVDPSPDQPAKRITNAEHHRIIAARTPAQKTDYAAAEERLRQVVNKLIKGSIIDPHPPQSAGDLVADESIYDLAGPSAGLGIRPDKNRGAAYFGKYYSREQKSGPLHDNADHRSGKHGFGFGVTTLTGVGTDNNLHAVAPVIRAAEIHHPTSGSIDALRHCIEQMARNGLDTRPAGSTTWPRFTVDMGYSTKRDFPLLMLEKQYTPIFRYKSNVSLTEPSAHSRERNQRLMGPIQFAGAFYCPAAERLLRGHHIPRTRDLLANGGWEDHDIKLRAVLPFLMGTNSRPFLGRHRGRPRLGALPDRQVKIELVCPAVQQRVQCPLKPESIQRAEVGTPMANPTWTAQERQCCAQSSITLTLTRPQLQKAQWGLVGASWEHTLYHEAGRALTEQRFSLLKSPHITGIANMAWGPRREPMVKILIALAIAATNHQIQKTHNARGRREESIDIRWRQLQSHLGHEPTRTPPRT